MIESNEDCLLRVLRAAVKAGWIADPAMLKDLEELESARRDAKRHRAHYEMVRQVVLYRWLPSLRAADAGET